MFNLNAFRPAEALSFAAGIAIAIAAAAQCQPSWDPAIGVPGINGGYAAPILAYNDGSGDRVYVGGSFSTAGGSAANRYLGRWDPATGAWSALGSGISPGNTNAFMTSLVAFNPGAGTRLVAGGFYASAGGVANTASLAMWNGQAWEALGTGWTQTTRGSIWAMTVWNGRLYVGGGVVSQPPLIAGLPWAGVASWDGQNWAVLAGGVAGSFSPYVAALATYNDGTGEALYAGGRFDSAGGAANTAWLARWNGTNWSSVGGGVFGTGTLFGLEGLTVFDDGSGPALYAAGYAFTPSGQGTCNVAKWNGQSWTALGGQIGTGRLTAITSFDDGGGNKLYIGGTAMPQINYIARWESNQWLPVGGGVTGGAIPPSNFPSVFGLGVAYGALYAGGNFVTIGGQTANGVAAWTGCTACYPDCNTDGALTVADFGCFQTKFVAADPYADCNADGGLTVQDFGCFQTKFVAGCP